MTSSELTPRFSSEPPDPPESLPPVGETEGGAPTHYDVPLDEFGDVFYTPPPGSMPEGDDPWT